MEESDETDSMCGVKPDTPEWRGEPYSTPRLTQYGSLTAATKAPQGAEEYKAKVVVLVTALNQ
jgi:hypothetical protein